jgi:hypothetical protein
MNAIPVPQAIPVQHDTTTANRALISQLSDDLSWLETHCRRQEALGKKVNLLRYAAGLVRNLIGPFIDGQSASPLHVAVVGGAGAGKSSVANFLAGALLAEANPQAGFTRHPTAYTSVDGAITWPAHLNFLGPLKRLTEDTPANLDADVYQVRRVTVQEGALTLLPKFVVWDCPDMTTWAATGYIPRMIEIAALADVLVYVASDERYNDEVPTQFLQMLADSGKAIVVCLVKMKEADAPAFTEHFRKDVLGKISARTLPCVTIPHLTRDELADPLNLAKRHQIPLLNQISVVGDPPREARNQSVKTAMQYLTSHQEKILGVARDDLAALQTWRNLVQNGQIEFDNRYQREYLSGEKLHRFDEALVRLLQLLELPGVGKVLSGALYVVRTPYRLVKHLFNKALQRPPTPPIPEKPVLDMAMQSWIDMLRKEASRRADDHPLWKHLSKGFEGGLDGRVKEQFEQAVQAFHRSQTDEIDRTARAIYEELEKNPVALNTLRGTKFALEVTAIASACVSGGLTPWDLLWAPLAASITHQLVELIGKGYVETQREQARLRQQALVTQYVSGPMAQWLASWPVSGGSEYERLQLILHRLPLTLQRLAEVVSEKMKG